MPGSTDVQARALLDSASKINGLFSDDLKPWHLTATVTGVWREPKPRPERIEVWSAGRYKRQISSETEGKQSVAWSTSRTGRYRSPHLSMTPWEPFSHPLNLAGYFRPDIELELKHLEVGMPLDCISVVHPERYGKSTYRAFYPSLCFDKKMRLRLVSYGQVVTQYGSYRTFQGREVAGQAKISAHGDTLTEAKLDSLDVLDKVDDKKLTPDQDAVKDPYTIEPGDPEPLVSHREAGATYLAADKIHLNQLVLVSAILQQDGSVKVAKDARVSYQHIDGQVIDMVGTSNSISNSLSAAPRLEPLTAAARRWRFEPYKIDGEAIEVQINIAFTEDGKPWTP